MCVTAHETRKETRRWGRELMKGAKGKEGTENMWPQSKPTFGK